MSASIGQRLWPSLAAIFLLWLAIFVPGLPHPSLFDDADGAHAEAGREMLTLHDWVTLHENGIRYLEKAPLPYWAMAVSFRLFGVSESSAIKWVQRFERSGSRAASRMGGYLRPKLEPHREFLEALRGDKSDITLKALCHRLLVERGVKADTSMMSRFFRRLGVTHKKRRSSRASGIVRT